MSIKDKTLELGMFLSLLWGKKEKFMPKKFTKKTRTKKTFHQLEISIQKKHFVNNLKSVRLPSFTNLRK